MSKVTNLEEHRPHYRITGKDGNQYVLPLSLVEDIISGKTSVGQLFDATLRTIISEWHEDRKWQRD